jgi:hypothetical protein
MAERVGEVETLRDVDFKRGQGGEFASKNKGAVEEVGDVPVQFRLAHALITFIAKRTQNGIEVACVDEAAGVFAPRRHDLPSYRWGFTFGEVPEMNVIVTEDFGGVVSVSYLGHSDRGTANLLAKGTLGSAGDVVRLEPERNGLERLGVWASPVVDATFCGVDDWQRVVRMGVQGFSGKGMMFGEVGFYPGLQDGPRVRVSMATFDNAGCVRIERGSWVPVPGVLNTVTRRGVIGRFAEVSLFASNIKILEGTSSPLSNGIWHLSLVHLLTRYIFGPLEHRQPMLSAKNFRDRLAEDFLINWDEIIVQIGKGALRQEKERLINVIGTLVH